MTEVRLRKDLAIDLIDTKLRVIRDYINQILSRWGYDSGEKFISDVKAGTIDEAEEDAISLRHLYQQQQQELHQLKSGM